MATRIFAHGLKNYSSVILPSLLFQIDAHVDKDLLEEEEEAATSGLPTNSIFSSVLFLKLKYYIPF